MKILIYISLLIIQEFQATLSFLSEVDSATVTFITAKNSHSLHHHSM